MAGHGVAWLGWARLGRDGKRGPDMATNGATTTKVLETLEGATNGGKETLRVPYIVRMTIEGTAALLFHAWNNESVAEKSKAAT